MRNLYNHTLPVLALASTTRTNGTANGVAVDCGAFSNNFRDVLFCVTTGNITDGDHAITVQESDVSGSGYAAVPSNRVLGSLPTIQSLDDDKVFGFGVRPTKRYVRVVATTSGATTGGHFSVTAVLGGGSNNPPAKS